MQPAIKFMGVYSTQTKSGEQRGQKELFFVWQVHNNDQIKIHVQEIDKTYHPKSKVYAIDGTTFTFFNFEPSILAVPKTQLKEILGQQQEKTDKSAPYKTEHQQKAPQNTVLDDNIWRLGLKVPPGEQAPSPQQEDNSLEKAQIRLEQALRNDFNEAIKQLNQPHARRGALRFIKTIPEQKSIRVHHKHMLKDFMTTLRKQDLPEIALMFATKNVELAPDDDHAHFNLARIFCILERYQDAIAHLHRALDLPNETEDQQIYRKMLRYVENQQRHRQVPFRITKQ
ncbi:MAG: hypothetical protein J5846_03690 [Desulfovibrio sp.]|nr:hypothetical protein [Desulfovibrio sp.]